MRVIRGTTCAGWSVCSSPGSVERTPNRSPRDDEQPPGGRATTRWSSLSRPPRGVSSTAGRSPPRIAAKALAPESYAPKATTVAVKPCRWLRPPTGPNSPAAKKPATPSMPSAPRTARTSWSAEREHRAAPPVAGEHECAGHACQPDPVLEGGEHLGEVVVRGVGVAQLELHRGADRYDVADGERPATPGRRRRWAAPGSRRHRARRRTRPSRCRAAARVRQAPAPPPAAWRRRPARGSAPVGRRARGSLTVGRGDGERAARSGGSPATPRVRRDVTADEDTDRTACRRPGRRAAAGSARLRAARRRGPRRGAGPRRLSVRAADEPVGGERPRVGQQDPDDVVVTALGHPDDGDRVGRYGSPRGGSRAADTPGSTAAHTLTRPDALDALAGGHHAVRRAAHDGVRVEPLGGAGERSRGGVGLAPGHEDAGQVGAGTAQRCERHRDGELGRAAPGPRPAPGRRPPGTPTRHPSCRAAGRPDYGGSLIRPGRSARRHGGAARPTGLTVLGRRSAVQRFRAGRRALAARAGRTYRREGDP